MLYVTRSELLVKKYNYIMLYKTQKQDRVNYSFRSKIDFIEENFDNTIQLAKKA